MQYLVNSTDPVIQLYFKSVKSVEAIAMSSSGMTPGGSAGMDQANNTSQHGGNEGGQGSRLSTGAIVGIIVGVLAAIAIAALLWYLCLRLRSDDEPKKDEDEEDGYAEAAASGVIGSSRTFQQEAAPPALRNKKSVAAPQGKLGLILKSSVEGAEIHHVKPESPLYGRLVAGDTIVRIDCDDGTYMDTTEVTVNEVSAFLSKTKAHHRIIMVLSDTGPGQEAAAVPQQMQQSLPAAPVYPPARQPPSYTGQPPPQAPPPATAVAAVAAIPAAVLLLRNEGQARKTAAVQLVQ